MSINYTDLNKHCPMDPFPLPRIDQVVGSTAGSVLLYFLNCYSQYHLIALHPDDEDKTAFMMPHDIYCLLTVKIRQPSHEFTFGVGITFVSYSLVLTPVV
jgi:hypothetical protein